MTRATLCHTLAMPLIYAHTGTHTNTHTHVIHNLIIIISPLIIPFDGGTKLNKHVHYQKVLQSYKPEEFKCTQSKPLLILLWVNGLVEIIEIISK